MLMRFFVRFAAYPVALSLLIAGVAIAPGMPMPLTWLVALAVVGALMAVTVLICRPPRRTVVRNSSAVRSRAALGST